jgi:DNA polymerase III sliding clamp (beta) subunit (PCNA family)
MRTLVKAKILVDGLKVVSKAVPPRTPTLILGCCRIEVGNGLMMRITATSLDITHTLELPILSGAEGIVLVPARQMLDLVAKLASDAEVSLEQNGDSPCRVSSGRGRWTLPALTPADWPQSKPLSADAATGARRRQTCHRAPQISDQHRAHALLPERHSSAPAGRSTDRGRNGRASTGAHRLYGTYPNYAQAIPQPSTNSVEFKSADLLAAIGRHVAVGRHIAAARTDTVIGLTWSNGTFAACLAHHEDDAVEDIAAKVTGAGRVAVASSYPVDALKALATETVVIDSDDEHAPIRITAAAEPDTLMLVMPMVWPRQAEAAE